MGRASALIVWLTVMVLWAVVPLAHATPPDPTYVAGIWDNADFDDVVVLATSSTGVTTGHSAGDLTRPLVVIASVREADNRLFPAAGTSPYPPRAPPAS